jgi:hypothetical protein
MTNELAKRQPNAIGSHPVSLENEKQAAERRRIKDALEDDEVYEALASLRAARVGRDRSRPPLENAVRFAREDPRCGASDD